MTSGHRGGALLVLTHQSGLRAVGTVERATQERVRPISLMLSVRLGSAFNAVAGSWGI